LAGQSNPQEMGDSLGSIIQGTHEASPTPAEDLGDSSLDLLLYNQHTYL
jgi:hypothetical protein